MPLRVKNEVVCSAGALLGTVSASSAKIDIVALACSVGFVRGAVFCCEFKESVGPPFPTFCRKRPDGQTLRTGPNKARPSLYAPVSMP